MLFNGIDRRKHHGEGFGGTVLSPAEQVYRGPGCCVTGKEKTAEPFNGDYFPAFYEADCPGNDIVTRHGVTMRVCQ